jgi:hypothetical protein
VRRSILRERNLLVPPQLLPWHPPSQQHNLLFLRMLLRASSTADASCKPSPHTPPESPVVFSASATLLAMCSENMFLSKLCKYSAVPIIVNFVTALCSHPSRPGSFQLVFLRSTMLCARSSTA